MILKLKSISEGIKLVLEAIRKINLTGFFCVVFFFCISILLIPQNILEITKLEEFVNNNIGNIVLCTLLSCIYLIYRIISVIQKLIKERLIRYKAKKVLINYVHKKISLDEQELLVDSFFDKKNNCFNLSGYIEYNDGRKAPLVHNNVIYRASSMAVSYVTMPYNLHPIIYDYLNKCLKTDKLKINKKQFAFK